MKTPLILQSGMVLQREQPVPIWGKGSPGKKVIAELNGLKDSTDINPDGTWSLTLPPMNAGGPYDLTIRSENEVLKYSDVYLGDVWIASGQSNMQMTLGESNPPDEEIDQSDNQKIRQFLVNRALKNSSAEEVPAGSAWTPATQDHVSSYSAVAYYFAKYLYEYLNVPVGIINTSYGGTRIESWMSSGMLGYDEKDIVLGDGSSYLQPTVAYNAMLHPIRKVPVKGFIWYQGESNADNASETMLYQNTFKQLINEWRKLWNMGDLPFLWVQLPNFGTPNSEDAPANWEGWSLLRESQSSALSLPNTGEAIAIDVGEEDIHPKNKQPVGKRLALIARKIAYADDTVVCSGPRYESHTSLPDGKVEISFNYDGSGLLAKNTALNELKWFSIVKQNGSIVKANAILEDNKVTVWNTEVSDPLAIRYAWEQNPVGVNFYNKAGLPAAPFYVFIDEMDLGFRTYAADRTYIDRGQSAKLRWEVFTSDSILLNGALVDRKSGIRVWPSRDSVFTLTAFDPLNREISTSKSITIKVRQPIPVIQISNNNASIVPLDSTINITSTYSREGGEAIQKVEFYLNDKLLYTDFEEPYELIWKADTLGDFSISAIIYNELNVNTKSNILNVSVQELIFNKYEAEEATYIPGGRILESPLASNGLYLDLFTNWTLSFDSVEVDTSGNNILYIRYLLNHGSPRVQNLFVNDSLIGSIRFTAPDIRTWQDYITTIPMDSGINKISIEALWDYMSFDYILVGISASEKVIDIIPEDTTGISHNNYADIISLNNYPNPFTCQTTIAFNLPEKELLSLKVFDLKGREIATLADEEYNKGIHHISFMPPAGNNTIYILRMVYKGNVYIRKLVEIK